LLARVDLEEINVQHGPAGGVLLHLADERIRRLATVDAQADDRVLHADGGEQLLELLRLQRDGPRLVAVAVDDARHQPLPAQPAHGVLPSLLARLSGQGYGGHILLPAESPDSAWRRPPRRFNVT